MLYIGKETKKLIEKALTKQIQVFVRSCKVEFNQPSYWFYSVPNLLVF